jgi:hypothetical protein
MRHVQIRVSKHSCLDRLLEDISKEVWQKMKNILPAEDSTDDYSSLRKLIKRAVKRRVHKYPNCGLAEACHDEIEGGPWMDYSDKIYMLSVENDIDGFINDIAKQIVTNTVDRLPIRSEMFSVISTTLHHEFGKYLYFNPVCRTIPFCQLQLD